MVIIYCNVNRKVHVLFDNTFSGISIGITSWTDICYVI